MKLCGALLVFLALAGGAASAQDAPGPASAQFNAVIDAAQHRAAVLAAAKQSTTWIRHGCQDATFARSRTIVIWKRPAFDASNVPVTGLWVESVVASGCGISRVLNVATAVRAPGELVSAVLAPGTTAASPSLQKDAAHDAFVAALARVKDCQQAFIDDTARVREERADPADGRLTGPVRVENWTVAACGQSVVVEMKFLPLASGTDIVAHAM